ncbi:hypothetical protein [Vibrio comitans]|uniref:Lipoprotein n=1 Tax=Vibrio comitans NBRC 102076 TaxID=1219078 RepID=A0A4Y3IHM2_9VIBR|nr:hypothetical protein [Vibrio comitans]GEA58907.1 hypothetical protein VCO01S_01000 [Vibrio comitans NBRC 102076]
MKLRALCTALTVATLAGCGGGGDDSKPQNESNPEQAKAKVEQKKTGSHFFPDSVQVVRLTNIEDMNDYQDITLDGGHMYLLNDEGSFDVEFGAVHKCGDEDF